MQNDTPDGAPLGFPNGVLVGGSLEPDDAPERFSILHRPAAEIGVNARHEVRAPHSIVINGKCLHEPEPKKALSSWPGRSGRLPQSDEAFCSTRPSVKTRFSWAINTPHSSSRRGEDRCRQAPGIDSALDERLRASPSDPPPSRGWCLQRPSHEHERPAPRPRGSALLGTFDPAGRTVGAINLHGGLPPPSC